MSILKRTALISLSVVPLVATATDTPLQSSSNHAQHSAAAKNTASPLIDTVRSATAQFRDINVAISEGWVQATPCVSGPILGAMGVHFAQPERLQDAVLDAEEPELLIYEPLENGAMRLVGVEFIVIASAWASANPEGGAPALAGHLLNFVGEPNRYGLPAFYEMHVWAWERNPIGAFADFNPKVSCEKQPLE
jgi:hypothetical protein